MSSAARNASASDASGGAAAGAQVEKQPKRPRYNDTSAEFYVVLKHADGIKAATAQSLLNTATREESPFELPVTAVDNWQFKIRYADGAPVSLRAALTMIKRRIQKKAALEHLKA